ncbi:MAG TPA: DUF2867 domain-containing protein [Pseudomonas sp.]|uniref:DUF2867 domain-containing protein n=1 Tax=Pseudomonas sp. TaxID=306 RepID=UPI002D164CF0|nr:DUF2867 domain-containing protein [Pseudomonas sp.]HSX89956.1 DUF2867 domain-containing protein [Pseudomonas sp.]
MPQVIEVPVPHDCSLLDRFQSVYFCDAYQTSLSKPNLSVQDAYEAVFAHPPGWAKGLMKVRGLLASVLGLKHVEDALLAQDQGMKYQVGQRAGLFSIQSIEPNELVVGDDDKHLNFKISIYKSSANGVQVLTLSTAVEVHNGVGKLYMLVVTPFHRLIARSMLQKAADSGRL